MYANLHAWQRIHMLSAGSGSDLRGEPGALPLERRQRGAERRVRVGPVLAPYQAGKLPGDGAEPGRKRQGIRTV